MLSELEKIKTLISDNGLDIARYKERVLERKIQSRMRANRIDSFKDYTEFLGNSIEEMKILLDSLSINVTSFFRDSSTFDFFRNEVLPVIIQNKEKENKKIIRIWSIGCSTGEEPYSLAMIASGIADRFRVSIFATDMDKNAIAKARSGEYEDSQVRETKQFLRFFDHKDGRYKINNEIRGTVRFLHHDILSGKGYRFFDAIFCRNLLIYLLRDAQRDVLNTIYNSLNPGGFLILGKTEIMQKELSDRFILASLEERVYRKI